METYLIGGGLVVLVLGAFWYVRSRRKSDKRNGFGGGAGDPRPPTHLE